MQASASARRVAAACCIAAIATMATLAGVRAAASDDIPYGEAASTVRCYVHVLGGDAASAAAARSASQVAAVRDGLTDWVSTPHDDVVLGSAPMGYGGGPPFTDDGLRRALSAVVPRDVATVVEYSRHASASAFAALVDFVWRRKGVVVPPVAHQQASPTARLNLLAARSAPLPHVMRVATALSAAGVSAQVSKVQPGAHGLVDNLVHRHPALLHQPVVLHAHGFDADCPLHTSATGGCIAEQLAALLAAFHGAPHGVLVLTAPRQLLAPASTAVLGQEVLSALPAAMQHAGVDAGCQLRLHTAAGWSAVITAGVSMSAPAPLQPRVTGRRRHPQPLWMAVGFACTAANSTAPLSVPLRDGDNDDAPATAGEADAPRVGAAVPCDPATTPGFWHADRLNATDDPYYEAPERLQHRMQWRTFQPDTCPPPHYTEAVRAVVRGVDPHDPNVQLPDTAWLRDRVVLLVGDSFDRNVVTVACDAVGGTLRVLSTACPLSESSQREFESPFAGGLPLHCHIPKLNLHFVVVFLLGLDAFHTDIMARHVDPFLSPGANALLVNATARLVQASLLLQASRLDPDAVTMTTVHWPLLQRFLNYARHGRADPTINPFDAEWAARDYVSAANETVVQVVKDLFPSATYLAWRTVPPVNQPLVRSRKGVYYSDPSISKPFQNFDNDKVAVLNAAGRYLAATTGLQVFDLQHLLYGQEKLLFEDGYHFTRHMNLRLWELLLAQLHNHFVR